VSPPDQQAPEATARADQQSDAAGPGTTSAEPESSVIPPVVIVMVAHDPGEWFEETLASLAAQDYANASVLVLDAASTVDVRARAATVLPEAHYRRVDENLGFGATCNEVLQAVQGAAFFVFCHDDVRLDPEAVQVMVEEAFRSNAGIVGPKLVDWHRPDQLLSVGMAVDKTGYPAPYVERGELDQQQHDGVRDVFYVPGGATLVRSDLFEALGGFDPGIDFHGEDLDLCWRAHVAGARIVVAPAARVGHLEALGRRRPVDDRRRLQMRHRLRAMRVSYSWWTRTRIVPQAALLALLEVLYSVVLGRFRQARDIVSAWMWNLRRRRAVRARRKQVKSNRQVPDGDIRRLQVRGSGRLSAFLRGQIGSSEDRIASLAGARRDFAATFSSSKARTALLAWALVTLLLLVGSRDLLFGRIAAVGDFATFGTSGFDLIDHWTSGYNSSGLGSVEPNPTMLGFVGGIGVAMFNSLGLLRQILILGMLPLGAAGIWRLGKPVGSRRSRIVALLVYVAVPLPYNAIATGDWSALAVYGLAPWIVSHLTKASGMAPFGALGGEPGPGIRPRPLIQRIVAVGLLTALAAMVAPVVLVMVPAMALALVIGGLLAGQLAGALRLLAVGFGGAVVGLVLQLPWSTTLLNDDWSVIGGRTASAGQVDDLGALLRFETGPLGAGVLSFMFLGAAALSLLMGRQWRLAWSVRAWALAMASFAAVWVQTQGWLPGTGPSAGVLLVPAGIGLSLAAAMGMAAFEVDLPDYHFGWRQVFSVLAGVALFLAVLPVVGAAVDGRWSLPRGDYERALSFLDREAETEPFRVLWLGDAESLPLAGWELDGTGSGPSAERPNLAYATSENGTPRLDDRWAGSPEGATRQLDEALTIAAEGGSSRLGTLLAPMGVRYIVVVAAPAPEPYATPTVDPVVVQGILDAQLDLAPVTASGVTLYRNTAWAPTRAQLAPETQVPGGGDDVAGRTFPALEGAPPALTDTVGYQRFGGPVEPGVVYLAEAASGNWRLAVDGRTAERVDALGWSNAFTVDEGGEARLGFDTPTGRRLALAGQVALWVLAVAFLLRVRVLRDEGRVLHESNGAHGEERS
jgi:GT2 family glycosyltransferase